MGQRTPTRAFLSIPNVEAAGLEAAVEQVIAAYGEA